jgi:hypothetical protein
VDGQPLAEARDHVDDARREACLLEELRELQGGDRRLLCRFHDYRTAHGQRRASLKIRSSSGEFHGAMAPTTPSGSLLM